MDAIQPHAVRCVAIGASGAAGLTDIMTLLEQLPPPLDAVVMVVLHRPIDRMSNLRAVLARATTMPVVVAGEGEAMLCGTVYLGEPAQHLTMIGQSRAGLVDGERGEYRNRTVDTLFYSLAKHAGRSAIGVVLSGSLDDGARGLAAIHASGGATMVLTPDGGRHPGMPENAISYDGPIDMIGTPAEIAASIVTLLARG